MKEQTVHIAFIGLGTNLGDRLSNLSRAREFIVLSLGTIFKVSAVYESAPWGFQSVHSFYNQCISVHTSLAPKQLLFGLKHIEKEMGRMSSGASYSDRIIDLDILFFDEVLLEEKDLIIPHPAIARRMFVLKPLMDIAADHYHPRLKQSIAELFSLCEDPLPAVRLPNK